jgi:hypothetical protein
LLRQIQTSKKKHAGMMYLESNNVRTRPCPIKTWPSLLLPHIKNTVTRNIDVASNWHGGSMLGSRDSEIT